MKKVLDQWPEKSNKKISERKSTESPPAYVQATSISTHSSWKKELCTAHSPVRYPDLNDRQIMTACPPSTLDVQNTTWIQSCSIIALKPIKMSDIEMICKSLPSATNPTRFVEFFNTHTRHMHNSQDQITRQYYLEYQTPMSQKQYSLKSAQHCLLTMIKQRAKEYHVVQTHIFGLILTM